MKKFGSLDKTKRDALHERIFISIADIIDNEVKPYGILDIHDHCLNADECEEVGISEFDKYNMLFEHRYLSFMEKIYEQSTSEILVEGLVFSKVSNMRIFKIFNEIDYADKLILIELLKRYGDDKEINFLVIDNIDELKLVVKLMTRELYFPMIHFTGVDISITGGHDLCLPVYFKSVQQVDRTIGIAKKCDLFIRNIELN